MTRHVLAALAALLLAPLLFAGDIEFDGPAEVPQYALAKFRPKSDVYKSFIVKVFGPDGKRVTTERGEGGWHLFTGPPGKYRADVTAGKTDKDGNLLLDEASREIVILGNAPEPVPPSPPAPSDPLAKAVSDAYRAETHTDKKALTAALGEVYSNAGALVRGAKVETYGQLAKAMDAGVEAAQIAGKLPKIKAAIGLNTKHLTAKNTTPIDESNRYALAGELEAVAAALKGVAK